MARFLYFFIVIFSFFVKDLFADPPIDTTEYLERCRKFSVPLSSILCPDLENIPPAFKECGLDPDKIMIINVESILNGAFTDEPERIFYYHELLESEEKLREAFRNTLLCHAPVVLEEGEKMEDAQARAETYHQFIFDTISSGFGFRKHRERIVSFLAALEYRQSLDSQFKIHQTESIQQALKENSIGDDLFVQLIMLGVRYIAFYNSWTTAEELFQITGAVVANDHIIVDTISDLDWLWNQKRLVRWLHSSMNNIEKPQDGPAINLAPEKKYADLLFFLHGLGI